MLPLGCEAAPAFFQRKRIVRFYDCFAAEREQAPSPQQHRNFIPQRYAPPPATAPEPPPLSESGAVSAH
ncbi:MAG: hypothetical protein C0411_16750 [Pseudomonas sp.]|nr:hypothetical protein [Pseudomonas sp.]